MGNTSVNTAITPGAARQTSGRPAWQRYLASHYQYYLMFLPAIVLILIFRYLPMTGIVLAFKRYSFSRGIFGSPWVGLKHFRQFIASPYFWLILKNTLVMSGYAMVTAWPFPILIALLLHHLRFKLIKKVLQTTLYAPRFISTVVVVGMMFIFLAPRSGVVNIVLSQFGIVPIHFLGEAGWFRHLFVLSNIWQFAGFGAIVYLAALSAVDPSLYEAASMDGANKFWIIRNIDLPTILPLIIVLLIMRIGHMLDVGFEKVLLMQTPLNLDTSEIIDTYIYKVGLQQARFSFAAAAGLLKSVVNVTLIVTFNSVAKRLGQTGIF